MKRALIAAAMVVGLASPAIAGHSSIALNQSDPVFGQAVTFTVENHKGEDWINLRCFVDGELVFYHSQRVGKTFRLGPSASWWSGEAECIAALSKQTNEGLAPVATTAFHVGA